MDEVFSDYTVWRLYADDQYIAHLIDRWANKYGSKRVVTWRTNRPRQIAWAVRNYEAAIAAGDIPHDGNPTMAEHVRNSRKRMLTVLDDEQRQMHTISKDTIRSPRKIDAAMAGVLSWEARGDAIAAGGVFLGELPEPPKRQVPRRWEPDTALPASALVPMGGTVAGPGTNLD